MKLIIRATAILLIVINNHHANAQVANWQWAHSAGGTNDDYCMGMATDGIGNTYITGSFRSPTITFGTTTLTNSGTFDIFIVKYDAAGNVLWAKSPGASDSLGGNSIATDASGNIFIGGGFSSASVTLGTNTLINAHAGTIDFFILKCDSAGNVLWAKGANGGTKNESVFGIKTDVFGNVYIDGSFESPNLTVGTTTLTNVGGSGTTDVFIAKYNSNGNEIWAKSAGSIAFDAAENLATDDSGNVYASGHFPNFPIMFDTITLTTAGIDDVFIVKYDSSGNVQWAKSAGGTQTEYSGGMVTDMLGDVYFTGSFSSPSINFGTITLTNAGPAGQGDFFIVKYDASGNVLWANSAGGAGWEFGLTLVKDSMGNVYATGSFGSASITFGTFTLTNSGIYDDGFIVKYDTAGNTLWATGYGGNNSDGAAGIDRDGQGNIIIAGNFRSSNITFGANTISNAGGSDVFVAKFDDVTGINEENNSSPSVIIYPNPAISQAVLKTSQPLHNATLTIENSLGEIIKQFIKINSQTISIEKGNLPGGIYFIQLIEDNKIIATKKLVITD